MACRAELCLISPAAKKPAAKKPAAKKPVKKEPKKKPKQEEKDKTLSEEELRGLYNKETGKNAEWRGKLTKGYLEWKKEKLG